MTNTLTQENDKDVEKKKASIYNLIEKAQTSIESSDYTEALKYYAQACQEIRTNLIESTNDEMELNYYKILLAKILLERGDATISNNATDSAQEDGKSYFKEALELLNNEEEQNALKSITENKNEVKADLYLYMAQLDTSHASLDYYKKAIECIQNSKNSPDVQSKLSSAYCSMAELYLTDLCFDPNAEELCNNAIEQAVSYSQTIEVNQVMANLRLSQARVKEAIECMMLVWDEIRIGCKSLSTLVGLSDENDMEDGGEDIKELEHVEHVQNLPSFDFRLQSAKLLLECCSQLSEKEEESSNSSIHDCSEASVLILGSLLAENDEIIEIYYLLGCSFTLLQKQDLALYYWNTTLDMLMNVMTGLKDDGMQEEEDELKDILERIDVVKLKIKQCSE